MSYKVVQRSVFALCLLWLTACVNLAGYDQRAYENATSLKPQNSCHGGEIQAGQQLWAQ